MQGRIDGYDEAHGYGWIHARASDGKLLKFWFHITFVTSGLPQIDALVTFTPFTAERGPRAKDIVIETEIKVPRDGVDALAGVETSTEGAA
jgi:hypothetical protein